MISAYETTRNILAIIGAGSVTATLGIGFFVLLGYLRNR